MYRESSFCLRQGYGGPAGVVSPRTGNLVYSWLARMKQARESGNCGRHFKGGQGLLEWQRLRLIRPAFLGRAVWRRALLCGVASVSLWLSSASAELGELSCGRKEIGREEAQRLLAKVQLAYEKVLSLHATFLQESYLSSLEVSETSSGDTWFRKPGEMKWWYRKPEEQQFLLKGTKIWIYQPTDKQVVVEELGAVLLSELPVAFLMGVGKLGETFSVDGGCETKAGVLLSLRPRNTSSGLTSFALLVDPARSLPRGARVVDDSGNRTSLYFSTLETNPTIVPETFEPRYPDGVDVDERG